MTPERWREVKAVLSTVLDLPHDQRAAYLLDACGSDADLRTEVESLLDADDGSNDDPLERGPIAATAEQSILERALGNRYEIVRPLGRGGMGAVYLAREPSLERFVAIKVLRPDLADVRETRERFRREARIAAQLSHPGIIPLHTFGEVGGIWYFVMGYVRGETLADRLRVEGRLDADDAQRILTELADALECAHRNGVIHRDIKPANILLDEASGRALLADFGVSKLNGTGDSLTLTGHVIGTPHYMSPEQAGGDARVDERSDIYSLGAVAYMMLTGREPFSGVRPEDLVRWRIAHDPPSLHSVHPEVPPALAAVVTRSMARDPAERWGSAESMRHALLRAGTVEASSAGLPESLRELPTFGPYAVLWALGWTSIALRKVGTPADSALLLLIATVVPIGLVLHVWNTGRHDLPAKELARFAFWPPEWWGMWWPAFLRRPTDLWRRLPWPARMVRVALSAFIALLPALILLRQGLENAMGAKSSALANWLVRGEWALAATASASLLFSLVWASRRGLAGRESIRLLLGSTMPSEGWREPHVIGLLTPVRQDKRNPDRDSPADLRRALESLVAELPAGATSLRTRVRRSASTLVSAIAALDAEKAALTCTANVGDVDRLAAQLAEMDASPPPRSAEQHQMANLVREQLALVRRIRDKCELVAQRRALALRLLRGLWTSIASLHDDVGQLPSSIPDVQLHALLDEIDGQFGGES